MDDQSRFLAGVVGFFFLIAIPLLVYLKSRAVPSLRTVVYFFVIYVLWYLPFSPIHEGSHYVAGRIVGLHASSYQFLPPFWRGDFIHGYIEWVDGSPSQILLSTQAPYAIDGLLVLLGYLLFRKRNAYGPFLGALILTETYLRSVFDVAVNYSAGTLARTGDFRHMLDGYPPITVHLGAWLIMLLGGWGAVSEIGTARTGATNYRAAAATPNK